jgi:hypothetical protein
MNDSTATASDDAQHEPPRPQYTLITNAAKFELGQLVATPGALALMERTKTNPALLVGRHLQADWGEICQEDRGLNEQALTDGSRLMSVYRLVSPETLAATLPKKRIDLPTVWIITEAIGESGRRASTCILLPEEY